MRYEVKFNVTGGTLPKIMYRFAIDEFVKRREVAIEQFNPNYELWNKEFDKLYPDLDGCSKEYSEFISNKQRAGLDMANRENIGMNLIKLVVDDDCDVYGVTKLFNNTEIRYYIMEKA